MCGGVLVFYWLGFYWLGGSPLKSVAILSFFFIALILARIGERWGIYLYISLLHLSQ